MYYKGTMYIPKFACKQVNVSDHVYFLQVFRVPYTRTA